MLHRLVFMIAFTFLLQPGAALAQAAGACPPGPVPVLRNADPGFAEALADLETIDVFSEAHPSDSQTARDYAGDLEGRLEARLRAAGLEIRRTGYGDDYAALYLRLSAVGAAAGQASPYHVSLDLLGASEGHLISRWSAGTTGCGNLAAMQGATDPLIDEVVHVWREANWKPPGDPIPFVHVDQIHTAGRRIYVDGCASSEHRVRCGLFVSDGSSQGTRHLLDASTWKAAELNGSLLFLAERERSARVWDLWRSSGTKDSTSPVKELGVKGPHGIAVTGRRAFVLADHAAGLGIWTSDGSPAGTQHVVDLPLAGREQVDSMAVLRRELYFVLQPRPYLDEPQRSFQLWRSDGTAAGTSAVKTVVKGHASELFLVQGRLLFSLVRAGQVKAELWRSDGTEAGTVKVQDLSRDGNAIGTLGDALLFSSGGSLWRTDGSEGGAVELGTVNARFPLGVHDGKAYLMDQRNRLWVTDGSPAGTRHVRDFEHLDSWGAASKNGLIFSAYDGTHGPEPWITDGTPGGTSILRDIVPGSDGAFPRRFTAFRGTVYFRAGSGERDGLWRSDGSAAGTRSIGVGRRP